MATRAVGTLRSPRTAPGQATLAPCTGSFPETFEELKPRGEGCQRATLAALCRETSRVYVLGDFGFQDLLCHLQQASETKYCALERLGKHVHKQKREVADAHTLKNKQNSLMTCYHYLVSYSGNLKLIFITINHK